MRKQLASILFALLVVVACGNSAPTEIEVTRVVTQPVEVTRIVESTMPVEVTRIVEQVVTATPEPVAPTAEAQPMPTGDNIFALNWLAEQEQGGIVLQIARVLIGDKQAVGERLGNDFDELPDFQPADTVGEVVFHVTNTTDQVLSIYPDQGTVLIGDEQLDLSRYMLYGFGDVGGDIHPGVIRTGGVWFPIRRSNVNDIQAMTVIVDAPTTEDFSNVGKDFRFELDLSNHVWEPMPDELR